MEATAHSNRETPVQQARVSHFLHTPPHDVVEEVVIGVENHSCNISDGGYLTPL
jgi:hypothetical protein